MEPISNRTKNKRHVSRIVNEKSRTTEKKFSTYSHGGAHIHSSVHQGKGRDHVYTLMGNKQASVRWADLTEHTRSSFNTADLDNPKHDKDVYYSVNSEEFPSDLSNSMGNISVGPLSFNDSFDQKHFDSDSGGGVVSLCNIVRVLKIFFDTLRYLNLT